MPGPQYDRPRRIDSSGSIRKKVKARRGTKIAIVATARHLAESVYWVLTKQEAYREIKARKASSLS